MGSLVSMSYLQQTNELLGAATTIPGTDSVVPSLLQRMAKQ